MCLCKAEREGFEPPVPLSTTVFKTVVIDHSTISPMVSNQVLYCKSDAKVTTIFEITKCFANFFEVCLSYFLKNRILHFIIMSDEILMVSL